MPKSNPKYNTDIVSPLQLKILLIFPNSGSNPIMPTTQVKNNTPKNSKNLGIFLMRFFSGRQTFLISLLLKYRFRLFSFNYYHPTCNHPKHKTFINHQPTFHKENRQPTTSQNPEKNYLKGVKFIQRLWKAELRAL
jgi:hypothetical protein